jgi:NADH-quinone oxidoreductase subunit A
MTPLWPLALYAACAIALVVVMLGLSAVLGERHREPATGIPYEGGIAGTGTANVPFPAKFYLVAMFFVIFDLESAFLFGWAVAARQLGWTAYVEMIIFVAVLVITLWYLARTGALDWAPESRRREPLERLP